MRLAPLFHTALPVALDSLTHISFFQLFHMARSIALYGSLNCYGLADTHLAVQQSPPSRLRLGLVLMVGVVPMVMTLMGCQVVRETLNDDWRCFTGEEKNIYDYEGQDWSNVGEEQSSEAAKLWTLSLPKRITKQNYDENE